MTNLDPKDRGRLEEFLIPGETIMWSGKPNGLRKDVRLFRKAFKHAAGMTFVLFVFAFTFYRSAWDGLIANINGGLAAALVFALLFVIYSVLKLFHFRRTLFALTADRALVLPPPTLINHLANIILKAPFLSGLKPNPEEFGFDLELIGSTSVREEKDGDGDILFHIRPDNTRRGELRDGYGFFRLPQIRDVERQLLQLRNQRLKRNHV